MQMMSSVTGFVDDTGHVGEFIGSQGVPEYWTSCFLNLDQSRRAAASIRMITHRLVLSWEHFVKFARTTFPLTTAQKYFSIKKSRWTHKKDYKWFLMKFGTERPIHCSAARLDSNLVLQNWRIARIDFKGTSNPKKEDLMRNSPFCTTHDEKTTYSGQQWFLRPLMWGYICNGCVEKREEKKLVTMLTRSQRWIKEGENCFLPLLVPWPELGWPAILGPKFFLSKLTCVSLCFAFFSHCSALLFWLWMRCYMTWKMWSGRIRSGDNIHLPGQRVPPQYHIVPLCLPWVDKDKQFGR